MTATMTEVRVVLADDHPVVRNGLRHLLEQARDIVVVGEAADGAAALRLVEELAPDVLLLDMELPVVSGVEVARQLAAAGAPVRVLGISAYDDPAYVFGLLNSGATGYLTKDEALAMVADAVRGIARGETGWLSRRAAARLVRRHQATAAPEDFLTAPMALSEREDQVLRLAARGSSNEQIAGALCLSMGTVKNHVTSIYSKLGVRSRAAAIAWAWERGLVAKSGPSER